MEQKPLRRSGVAACRASNQNSPQNARKNMQRAAPRDREAERQNQIRDCAARQKHERQRLAEAETGIGRGETRSRPDWPTGETLRLHANAQNHLTSIRRNYSAFFCGMFPSNPRPLRGGRTGKGGIHPAFVEPQPPLLKQITLLPMRHAVGRKAGKHDGQVWTRSRHLSWSVRKVTFVRGWAAGSAGSVLRARSELPDRGFRRDG